MLRKKRAASILEYTIVVAAVALAIYMMSQYIQNGLQGKYKEAGEVFGFGHQR